MANENSRGTSLRLMILAVALIISIMVSTSTTTAGIFHVGAARTVTLTSGPTLTITLGSGTGAYTLIPGVNVTPSPKPSVGVNASQPACYIFVKMVEANDASGIVSASIDTANFTQYNETAYYYAECAANTAKSIDVLSGDKITVSTTATLTQIQAATTTNITYTIYACGVQKANLSPQQAYEIANDYI